MREILFRGKDVDRKKWVYGGYSLYPHTRFPCKPTIYEVDLGCWHPVEVVHETVCQYSGLNDKNGKKIFEGDIVLGRFEFGMKVPSLVVFRDGAFGLEWAHAGKTVFTAFTGFCNVTFEVIGNVYDNPELLNKEA